MIFIGESKMRLKRINIENFGIYKGPCVFNFPFNLDKKVSLLIGQNGSGKTTFLNAIKIALYGSMLYGTKKITTKYSDYVLNILNSDAKLNINSNYAIEITFISNFLKYDGVYTIKREWEIQDAQINEKVILYKNGTLLNDNEAEEFFNAFYRYYPLELFDMFYLDGEKIDYLTAINSNIYHLIETSLNLDLFKYLKEDFLTYAIKKLNNLQLTTLEEEKQKLSQSEKQLINILEQTKSTLLETQNDKQLLNEKITDTLLNISESNTNIPEKISNLTLKVESLKKELSQHLNEYGPFLLIQNDLNRLDNTLSQEFQAYHDRILHDAMNESLIEYLHQRNEIGVHIIENLINQIKELYSSSINQLHKISIDDRNSISIHKSRISHDILDHVKSLITKYNASLSELKELNELNKEIPVISTSILLEGLLLLQKEDTLMSGKINLLEIEVLNSSKSLLSIQNRLSELDKEIWKALKASNVNLIITQVDKVLVEYMEVIKNEKLKKVEYYTIAMFSKLVRKENFIKEIHFDKNNIELISYEGHVMYIDNLSSGERLLMILSFIYAIICVSERSIPLIFDTLLGRLDKQHQQRVFENFIASCPDQVILLATDSELENILPSTIDSLTNTKYKIDFSSSNNKIVELR